MLEIIINIYISRSALIATYVLMCVWFIVVVGVIIKVSVVVLVVVDVVFYFPQHRLQRVSVLLLVVLVV